MKTRLLGLSLQSEARAGRADLQAALDYAPQGDRWPRSHRLSSHHDSLLAIEESQ